MPPAACEAHEAWNNDIKVLTPCGISNNGRERRPSPILPTVVIAMLALCYLLVSSWAVATPISLGSQPDILQAATGLKPLVFSSSGSFKVATFHDLHFGEGENQPWGPLQDVGSVKVMETVMDSEKPQFLVYNGDLITGENTFKQNSTLYLDKIVAPAVARQIPWASTYGNHDNDVNITHALIMQREQQLYPSLSHTSSFFGGSNPNGPANYFVPVYANTGTPPTLATPPALLLWFFDSRSGKAYGTGASVPDWVDASVATWLNDTADALTHAWGTLPPSLAFVHIPTNESALYQKVLIGPANGHDSKKENPDRPGLSNPGLDDDYLLASQGGENYLKQPYSGQDQPFISALRYKLGKRTRAGGGLFAVVSGHDHGCAWCAKGAAADALTVCFGRHSGYGGYGTWKRGSRIFDFDSKSPSRVRTYNAMEDGTILDDVELAI